MTGEGSPRGSASSRLEAGWTALFCAWFVAAAAAGGSLFFSQVMDFAPCVLCWYQRICLFPLVLMLPFGLFPYEPKAARFSLPLVVAGGLIAAYHNFVYYGWVPESLSPCVRGVSCRERYAEWLGFVTIPLLSLAAFALIAGLLVIVWKEDKK